MSTRLLMYLLESLDNKKSKVHKMAMEYCRREREFYHKVERYILIRDDKAIEVRNLNEVADLKVSIAKIEASDKIIDDMFTLKESIKVLREYVDSGKLVPLETSQDTRNPIIKEAVDLMEQANQYIFIASEEKIFLKDRFEFFKISSIIEKSDALELTDDELEKLQAELEKIRGIFKRGEVIHLNKLDEELSTLNLISEKLYSFSKSFYNETIFPKLDLAQKALLEEKTYDKKATIFYKYIKETLYFLEAVKSNCNKVDLRKESRLATEKDRLKTLKEKELLELEVAYQKGQGLLSKFQPKKSMSNSAKRHEIKKINEKYEELSIQYESNIDDIVAKDREKVETNLKLVSEFEHYLRENISGIRNRTNIK